jgi:hypothetical protein
MDLGLVDRPMKKIIIGLVIGALLIFVGIVLFKGSGGETQAAALAPEDTVFFVNIPNIPRTGFRWIGTALAQIAADPEMQAFLELPLKNLKESHSTGEATGVLVGLKPGNIFLAATHADGQRAEGLLGFQFWGNRKDYDNAIARLRKELPEPDQEVVKDTHNGLEILVTRHGDLTVYSAAAGRWGFLSTNLEQIKTALDRATGNSPLTSLKTNPRFVKVIAQLPVDPELLFYFEPEKMLDSLLAVSRSVAASQVPSQIEELKSAEAVGGMLKIDGRLQRDAIFVLRSSREDSLPKLTHPAMALTNRDTTVFFDFALNFTAIPSLVEGLAEAYPRAAAHLGPLTEAAAQIYGPECALVANWPDGNMTPTPLLAVTVKDEARSNDFLAQTIGNVPGTTRQDLKGNTVYSFPTGYTSLSMAQSNGFLLLGMNPEALLQAGEIKTSGGTLRDAPDFKDAISAFQSANEAFCYIDTRTVFTRVYNSFVPVIRFAGAMMPDLKTRIDVSKLPKAETIAKHLPPIVLSQKRTTEGTLIESSGPVSMTQFLILSSAGTMLANQSLLGN